MQSFILLTILVLKQSISLNKLFNIFKLIGVTQLNNMLNLWWFNSISW